MNTCARKVFFTLGVCLSQSVLAEESKWGCEVLLCLSNPNGPTAVSECKPPIQKLWRHLAKGRSFPSCAFVDGNGNTGTSSGNYGRHSWASLSNCAPGHIVYPEIGSPYCSVAGSVSVTVNNQLIKKVWWGKRGVPTDSDQSMVEENYALGSQKSDLELEYEAFLARKAEQERRHASESN